MRNYCADTFVGTTDEGNDLPRAHSDDGCNSLEACSGLYCLLRYFGAALAICFLMLAALILWPALIVVVAVSALCGAYRTGRAAIRLYVGLAVLRVDGIRERPN